MKKIINFFLIVVVLFACNSEESYKPPNLTKVSQEQFLQKAKNFDLPVPVKLIYRNIKGEILSLDSMRNMPNPESVTADYYQNDKGEYVEAIIRKATKQDLEFTEKLNEVISAGPEVKMIDIDCANKNQLLKRVYDNDQGMRKEGGKFDPHVERKNLETVISIIEKCGIPTREEVSEKELSAIWLALQHAPPPYQSKYISNLSVSAKRGDIAWEVIALMQDRALMYEGKPQIYGSQVGEELYNLFEPEYVNQRRAEMDMEPIEDYLKKFGIAFTVEQKNK